MSSHVFSASAGRPYVTVGRAPESDSMNVGAKPGDSLHLTGNGWGEGEVLLPPGARIEQRVYVSTRSVRNEDGSGYHDEPVESSYHVLVFKGGSLAMLVKPPMGDDGQPTQSYPHSGLTVKPWKADQSQHVGYGTVGEATTVFEVPNPYA